MRRSVSELARLKYVRNVTAVIAFLGMSVADFAAAMPSQWSTRKHISAQLVCDWKRGYRKPGEKQLHRIGELIANKLTARYGREIGVTLAVNSPWKVRAWVKCYRCGKWHELKRWNQRCKR